LGFAIAQPNLQDKNFSSKLETPNLKLLSFLLFKL
jgi:hypothetical protein